MAKAKRQKKAWKLSKEKLTEPSKVEFYEEEVYREINSRSFGHNFTILIQHYKKQIEQNPPKIESP